MDVDKSEFQVPMINICNLRCTFCQNSDEYQKNKIIVPVETVKKYIDFAVEWGAESIELGSLIGDSFLYPYNGFVEIVDYCNTFDNLEIQFFTSGEFYNERIFDLVNSINNPLVTISFYGYDKTHFQTRTGKDKYNNVMKTINYLKKCNNINLEINNRTNASNKYIDNELTGNFDIPEVVDFEWDLGNSDIITKVERAGHCKWMDDDVGINYDGEVVFCSWQDINGDTSLGHYTDGVDKLRKKMNFYKTLQDNKIFSGICATCNAYRYND